jgi:hypothetical protein
MKGVVAGILVAAIVLVVATEGEVVVGVGLEGAVLGTGREVKVKVEAVGRAVAVAVTVAAVAVAVAVAAAAVAGEVETTVAALGVVTGDPNRGEPLGDLL